MARFCTSCKYKLKVTCTHPNNMVSSPITSKPWPKYSAYVLRKGERENACGISGKWYEKKED